MKHRPKPLETKYRLAVLALDRIYSRVCVWSMEDAEDIIISTAIDAHDALRALGEIEYVRCTANTKKRVKKK